MAKKKKPSRLYLQTPARWYLAQRREEREGELLGHIAPDVARHKYTDLLKDDIKLLRKFSHGFEARDGYDLNKLIFIPDHKITRLHKYASELRREVRARPGETKIFRPLKSRTKRAAELYLRPIPLPKRKAYTVPVEKPETTKVSIVTRSHVVKDKRGRKRRIKKSAVRITRTVKGARIEDDSFMFADYTDDLPMTFEDMEEIIEAMLPHLPNGQYVFISNRYGNISAPMRKKQILSELAAKWLAYDLPKDRTGSDTQGLAETIIGLRRTGSTREHARREYEERLSTMEKMAEYRQAEKLGRLKEFRKKHGMDLIKHRFEKGRSGCKRCGKSQAKHLR